MYNTQKGPTKQNRVIRTPNIIKLTESGVVCTAYSYCYRIHRHKKHSLSFRCLTLLNLALESQSFKLPLCRWTFSLLLLVTSLLSSFVSFSISLFLSLSLSEHGSRNYALSVVHTHVQCESTFFRPDISANKRFAFTGSEHISQYIYENPVKMAGNFFSPILPMKSRTHVHSVQHSLKVLTSSIGTYAKCSLTTSH